MYKVGQIFYDRDFTYFKITKMCNIGDSTSILYEYMFRKDYNNIYAAATVYNEGLDKSYFKDKKLVDKVPELNGKEYNWDTGCWEIINVK